MNLHETALQIGAGNILAISGGRSARDGEDLLLPVGQGYRVRVHLDEGTDTYVVSREMTRGAKLWVKGVQTDVHAAELGETCYQASCYKNVDFGDEGQRHRATWS